MNEHEFVRQSLALAASGSLDPEELRRVERHTHDCEPCRRELQQWSVFTQGLRSLPQPSVPAELLQRTQSRILRERARRLQRGNDLMLGALGLLGWATSLAFWTMAILFTGGAFSLRGTGLISALMWSLASTLLVWITAGTAALILGNRRGLRRAL